MDRYERLVRLNELVSELLHAYNNGQLIKMSTTYKRVNYHLQKLDDDFGTASKISSCTAEELILLNQFNVKYMGVRQALDNTTKQLNANMKKYKQQHNKIVNGYFSKSTQIKSRHINLSCK